ncbi:glycosyltransferase family 2 protein [Psychrobacter sp. AOP22-C1-C5]|uniref:glycosyltransferase family 2 protein n=1 Tax=Psychrobacter sp. AOP22-C1-C5 TaxID=3457716 RepID=UPI0040358CCE
MPIIISIVIPIFNAQPYLRKCLDSLISKKLENTIEIILVNDGSDDGSKEIAIEYYHSYNNIQFLNQDNQGVFSARNNGLVHVRGEYVIFLDADDYLVEGAIEHLIRLVRKKSYDIVFFDVKLIGQKSLFKTKPYLPYYEIGSSISKTMFLNNNAIAGYMGGKLIRTMVAKQALSIISYKDIRIELYEDCYFLFCVAIYCKTALTINKEMYVYRVHKRSVTQREMPPQQVIEKLRVSKSYFEELERSFAIDFDKNNLQSLRKINRIVDSSIFIQTAKNSSYIKNIYKAWLLDSRFVNLARIIIYISTIGKIKK